METLILIIAGSTAIGFVVFVALLRHRNVHIWFVSYLQQIARRDRAAPGRPKHIMFCFVDHFEPRWRDPDYQTECDRVARWHLDYPKLAGKHVDADGVHPQHTFFYPEEEYREEHLASIADLCRRGFGEIEVHLHHDDDTPENFTATLSSFVELLHAKHGAFSRHPQTGKLAWAFIHGNWALCNSLADGSNCGIDEELVLLEQMGCYCDMTLPSAPSTSQTKMINSIYYATDVPGQSKSHNTGVKVQVGGEQSGNLMIVQGPLTLNWRSRKKGVLPAIENSDVRSGNEPTKERVDLWVNTGIHVQGKPDWIFVKVHTHGAQEPDMETLLAGPCDEMHSYLNDKYNDGEDYILHYTSTREMYNIIKAAEAGESGNPNEFRDYVIPKPAYK